MSDAAHRVPALRFSEAGLEVAPGGREAGWLVFVSAPEQAVRIPVVVLRGPAAGPTVWIQAGLHGDEGDGVVALLRWLETRRPSDLTGTVIAVPVLNTPAFRAGGAAYPTEAMNLNRAFAGTGRTWAERFAAWLLPLVLRHADVFLDLHGGGRSLDVAHFAFCGGGAPSMAHDRGRQLASASGVRYVCSPPPAHAGALYQVLAERGVPAVLLEAGGGSTWQEQGVAQHLRAIENILKALGVTTAAASDDGGVPVTPVFINRTVELWATEEAVVVARAAPGTEVRAGETVVQLRTLTGEPRPGIVSPLPSAVVLAIVATALLPSGGYACLLGERTR